MAVAVQIAGDGKLHGRHLDPRGTFTARFRIIQNPNNGQRPNEAPDSSAYTGTAVLASGPGQWDSHRFGLVAHFKPIPL